ncbi:MAG TPA: hypothetical protein VFZ77_12370 [Acidimicrobiales bacterium]
MAQGSDAPATAPKLHGTFTMRRLSGAGVVLSRHPTDTDPDRVVLAIGDSATNLVLDGTVDEIRALVAEAGEQLARLRPGDGGTAVERGDGGGVPAAGQASVP